MKYKSYYICHRCCNYISVNKSDIEKHFRINKVCESKSNMSFEEEYILSISRKYYINKDEEIDKSKLINYIKKYNENNEIEKNINVNNSLNILYDDKINKYKCIDCKCEFKSKQQLKKHLLNKNKCNIISKLQNELNDVETKILFEKIKQKCIENNISFEDLDIIINNYVKDNSNI